MYLKKLELSGFKSFAKSTTLEFPTRITAIVGPNGSGKSNIAESVRWVLGEQSMKSLRGKRGEDLIWNGSPVLPQGGPQVPRMGKASVELTFDNKDGKIPLEFGEVSIARKIFRDGINEYWMNDSQVRLKDVVELVAKMGLGETKHNIIGQGEVDRVLLSSPEERRSMLEEAFGLRVYQLKKEEAERKLALSENNSKQVEALLREITPHLKFLRSQAQKAKTREEHQQELVKLQKIFFSREKKLIAEEKKKRNSAKEPLLKKLGETKKESLRLAKELEREEKNILSDANGEAETKEKDFYRRRQELERELAKIEAKLEMEKTKPPPAPARGIDLNHIQEEIRRFVVEIKAILQDEEEVESLRSHMLVLVEDLEELVDQIGRGATKSSPAFPDSRLAKELENTLQSLRQELSKINQEIEKRERIQKESREEFRRSQLKIRELDQTLRQKRDQERDLEIELERFKFEEEKLQLREKTWREGMEEAHLGEEDLLPIDQEKEEHLPEDLRKKIERLKVRLEEIGGIDPAIVKEYQDLEARHSFLGKELEDLKQARKSLKELIKELEQHLEHDFKKSFSQIKEEFNKYFRIVFGGGKASLQIVKIPSKRAFKEGSEQEMTEDEEGKEKIIEGVELAVDLPRKRIKGLAMLSGGERALASIALLFAIVAVNPPPFLVLDETDAALDEANSLKYAALLKELSASTQLILVTHNRETMKCAGVLYGVTMGDEGVSKLLSLKLEEAEGYTVA